MNRRSDYLLYKTDEEIKDQAFREVARWFAAFVLTFLIGFALVPLVMP